MGCTIILRWLHIEALLPGERELAPAALAIKATPEAGTVIDAYDPTGKGSAHETFYQVVRIEWEERNEAISPHELAA